MRVSDDSIVNIKYECKDLQHTDFRFILGSFLIVIFLAGIVYLMLQGNNQKAEYENCVNNMTINSKYDSAFIKTICKKLTKKDTTVMPIFLPR